MSKASNAQAPRLRLATDIDFTKASENCDRCNGTGVVEHRTIDDPVNDGETIQVPVVCRCVTHGGGIKEDQLDVLIKKMVDDMNSDGFATRLADDIMTLPMIQRLKAIGQLEASAKDKEKPEHTRMVSRVAMKIIRQRMREAANGNA